jgi:sec-independent protein translocase protein TatC
MLGIKKIKKSNPPLKPKEDEMSFLEHLEALRWHIIRSLGAIVAVAIGVFMAKEFVFGTVILGPTREDFVTYRFFCSILDSLCFHPDGLQIINRDLQENFINHLKVSFWLGLVVAFPYVFYELWKFIKPGLYAKEVKAARGMVFICSTLFFVGVMFGYFVISAFAVTFLSTYNLDPTIQSTVTLSSLVNSMTMFTLPVGIIFELPVVVYFLAKIGLVTPEFMRQYRKHAFVVILILSAILTPPDMVTQILIAGPLYLLYEASIIICKRVYKKQEEEERRQEKAA